MAFTPSCRSLAGVPRACRAGGGNRRVRVEICIDLMYKYPLCAMVLGITSAAARRYRPCVMIG